MELENSPLERAAIGLTIAIASLLGSVVALAVTVTDLHAGDPVALAAVTTVGAAVHYPPVLLVLVGCGATAVGFHLTAGALRDATRYAAILSESDP